MSHSKYRMIYDIHTHTTFSHGKGSIEDNVKAAIARGLSLIGISDHGPGHKFYGVKHSNFPVMRQEIERLKPIYPQIEIHLGVEANIIDPSGRLDYTEEELRYFDYVLAGYHYGIFGSHPVHASKVHLQNLWTSYKGSRRASGASEDRRTTGRLRVSNTELVIKALHENRIKVLTHPGDKGPFDLPAVARACGETGTLMEISNWHEAPLVDDLRACRNIDVSFIVSSDAHSPERVGTFEKGFQRALEAGIDPSRIVNLEEK